MSEMNACPQDMEVDLSDSMYMNVSLTRHVSSAIRQTAVTEGFANVS